MSDSPVAHARALRFKFVDLGGGDASFVRDWALTAPFVSKNGTSAADLHAEMARVKAAADELIAALSALTIHARDYDQHHDSVGAQSRFEDAQRVIDARSSVDMLRGAAELSLVLVEHQGAK
jgi:hypothetical protein